MVKPYAMGPLLLLLGLLAFLTQHGRPVAAAPNRRLLQTTPSDMPPTLPIPKNPYLSVCPSDTQSYYTYAPYYVNGYPSSGIRFKPFTKYYTDPYDLTYSAKATRDDEKYNTKYYRGFKAPKHQMWGAEIEIREFESEGFYNVAPYCEKNKLKTWWMGYNGTVPGPTIRMPT
jgi:hypothetical protein